MSRSIRTLVLSQLIVALVGLAVVAQSQLALVASSEPLNLTSPMPEVIPAAAAKSAPKPVAKPVRKAAVKAAPAPRKHVVRRHRTHRVTRTATPRVRTTTTAVKLVSGSTAQQRMEAAVARIPGYVKGSTTWVLAAKDGYWGTADWYHNVIYISPSVPANRIYDVVTHEWSHLRSVQVYEGDVDAAMAAMNKYFGGSGLSGSEKAADCMARRLGATWTHYTACGDAHWQAGAATLLSGRRL